jgi:diadenosine tetraphosphatase ApaH/serine/threonine PP2A family protein phosphatase
VRVGVISDIHGNLVALDAVLGAIDDAGCAELWCLGDLVGYGARPNECCAGVRRRATTCLAGNHDLAVRATLPLTDFSGDARTAAEWTQTVLDDEARAYLDSLETSGARHGIELFHGSARDPIWEYVLTDEAALVTLVLTTAQVVLVGHSHVALQVSVDASLELAGGPAPDGTTVELGSRRWLFNPGSVGQPRDGDPRAAWLELDLDAKTARFHRVEYDVARTQAEIRAAGLPDVLAERLAHGL